MITSRSGFMAEGFCWIKLALFISEENLFLGWSCPHPTAEIMQSVSFYPPHMNHKKRIFHFLQIKRENKEQERNQT